MTDYPYEAIAANFKAIAGMKPKTADEIKVERVAPDARGIRVTPKPVRVHNKLKSAPMPKRVPGASLLTHFMVFTPMEIDLVKRHLNVHYVRAPWVEGVHFDSREN